MLEQTFWEIRYSIIGTSLLFVGACFATIFRNKLQHKLLMKCMLAILTTEAINAIAALLFTDRFVRV